MTLHLPYGQEFHFNKESDLVREEFCQRVRYSEFSARAVVVDKHLIDDPMLRKSATNFFKHVVKLLFDQNRDVIRNAKVIFDGKAVKDLPVFLRQELNVDENERLIRSVKFTDSGEIR